MKKIIVILLTLILIGGVYYFMSNGEALKSEKIKWLLDSEIAHRGLFNEEIPENSMKAFKNAIDNGYLIELDVQLTKDDKVIVFHDDNLKRMTGLDKEVGDVTYDEIKDLTLINSNEKIPTLEEVLEVTKDSKGLVIEIKTGDEVIKLSEEVYNTVKDYRGKYAVQSFDPFSLNWFKRNAKEVIRGQLSGSFETDGGDLKFYEKFILRNMLLNYKSKPNFIAYEIEALPNKRVESLRKSGLPILCWTVNDEEDLIKARKYCDNIIFDTISLNDKK